MKPVFELDARKVELLIRGALLDDAVNAGERLGALLADVNLDDDGDVSVCLDAELWPEDKTASQAVAVAELLSIDLEQTVTDMTAPFHWPALASETTSMVEYVSVLLDAYAGRTVDLRRQ
jgi:hypothetical protein